MGVCLYAVNAVVVTRSPVVVAGGATNSSRMNIVGVAGCHYCSVSVVVCRSDLLPLDALYTQDLFVVVLACVQFGRWGWVWSNSFAKSCTMYAAACAIYIYIPGRRRP